MTVYKLYEYDVDGKRQEPLFGFGRRDRFGDFKFITEEESVFIKLKYPDAFIVKADIYDCPPPEYEV